MKKIRKICAALLAASVAVACMQAPTAQALAVSSAPEASRSAVQHTIRNFPIIWQYPELPTGCEVTALTMTLRYYGFDVGKTSIAGKYLPTASPSFYYSGGRLRGPDMDKYFVGSPFSSEGYACGAQALCTAADRYFEDNDVDMRAKDISGSTPSQLYALVDKDTPVVVLVTIDMVDRYADFSWYSKDGRPMSLSYDDHGSVLIGYSPTTVTLADPISGEVTYSRSQFESVFKSRGSQCMILEDIVYESGYTDVPDGQWFASAAGYCRESGLMNGVDGGLFLPEGVMTRGMLASVLYRAAGEPEVKAENTFSDVQDGQWYTDSVLWVSENGIAEGYGNGRFGPNDPVTREQVVAALWRFAECPEAGPAKDFDDEKHISSFAAQAADWARGNGVVHGRDGNRFAPKDSMTRAELAAVLYNYMNMEHTEAP